jgi:transposase
MQNKIIAPMTFEGNCDRYLFETWLKKFLIPEIPKGSVLVMDNASFHKKGNIPDIVKVAGCKILYLAPYSPEDNPIEHYWPRIKNTARKNAESYHNFHDAIDAAFRHQLNINLVHYNFLILAFREMRDLEIQVLEEVYPKKNRQLELNIEKLNKVIVSQFYGIELEEFPAKIVETALWIVDHQMNMKLSETFGQAFVRLPLPKESVHIFQDNALTTDWNIVLPINQCNYILGNPPFIEPI